MSVSIPATPRGPGASGAPGRSASAESKLALAEFLLSNEEMENLAGRSLDWLAEHHPVRHALCLVVDVERNRLVTAAAHGITPDRAARFGLDLDDRGHPL